MPIHIDWNKADPLLVGHDFRGPLIGFAVALGLAFAGRFTRSGLLAAAAGGAGVAAGWYAISGGRIWAASQRPSVDHLTLAAIAVLVICLLAEQLGRSRGTMPALLLAAAFTGWWLCGAPRSRPDLLQAWPIGLGVGLAVLLYARSLATDAVDPLRIALTGLTMAASFQVVALPAIWVQLALVPVLASLALFALPAMSRPVAMPIAADIAAVGSLAVIAFGRLPRMRAGPVDIAAAAPLLALWLAPRLAGRFGFAGRAAGAGASVLAALIAVGIAWLAARTLPR